MALILKFPVSNNDVDELNTIDGKPLIYWVGRHDETVPTNAAYVVLVRLQQHPSHDLERGRHKPRFNIQLVHNRKQDNPQTTTESNLTNQTTCLMEILGTARTLESNW